MAAAAATARNNLLFPLPLSSSSSSSSSFLFSVLLLALLAMETSSVHAFALSPPPPPPPPPPSSLQLLSFLQQVQASAASSNLHGQNSATAAPFDPKTYVDLPLRYPLSQTSMAFNTLPRTPSGKIHADVFQRFMEEYFEEAGSDLVEHMPSDYREMRAGGEGEEGFVPGLRAADQRLRAWAQRVHGVWPQLSRSVSPAVALQPGQHTLLPLPHPVIVPGSRFREVYYWDTYWIIRGLIISKMLDTAKGMVENLLHLVKVYGFVLNGARAYYENRSQPPLLSAMVLEIYSVTKDSRLLEEALPLLIREHKYWTSDPKQVTIVDGEGNKHYLSRYWADWRAPRPESFTIDMDVAKGAPKSKRDDLYHNIATAAESGWDFSSRWMRDQQNLSTLFTSSIVPADLNAFLFQMENNIAFIANTLGNHVTAKKFANAARARNLAIHSVLWNENMGQWLDYILDPEECQILDNEKIYIWNDEDQRKIITASNFIPLWTGILSSDHPNVLKVVDALTHSGLICRAGIATSLRETGQQWDFPNAWPPLQHMIIEGLTLYGSSEGKALAKVIAHRWIETNFMVYSETSHMLEKYDATVCGGTGRGGEYQLQTGFGWSNGVVLCLLNDFGCSLNMSSVCAIGGSVQGSSTDMCRDAS